MATFHVLVIDPDARFRELLAADLARHGVSCHQAAEFDAGADILKTEAIDIVVLELFISRSDGMRALRDYKRLRPKTPIVVATSRASVCSAVEAVRCGASDFRPKPVAASDVLAILQGSSYAPREASLTLAQVHWEHINRTMREVSNNLSEAARRLGIHRQSLQRMLKKNPPYC